jgi:hypothetical protein
MCLLLVMVSVSILTVRDKSNSGSNSYKIDVGETDAVFQLNMKVENLKLLPGDYDVVCHVITSDKTIGHFTNHARAVEYYIPFENDSTYEGPTAMANYKVMYQLPDLQQVSVL